MLETSPEDLEQEILKENYAPPWPMNASNVNEVYMNHADLTVSDQRKNRSLDQAAVQRHINNTVSDNWQARLDKKQAMLTSAGVSKTVVEPALPSSLPVSAASTTPVPSYHNIDPTWVVGGILALSVASLIL